MKVVVLAGGLGARLAEETETRPKPMIEIGGRPIVWHITKHYSHHSFKEFFIALGYKGEVIKRYFLDYQTLGGNMTVDLSTGNIQTHDQNSEGWIVHLIDTGMETNTGGRLRRLETNLKNGTFMLTYGDGVSNVDLKELLSFHRSHGRIRPVGRYVTSAWIPGNFLTEATFLISAAISTMNPVIIHFHEQQAVAFQVFDSMDGGLSSWRLRRSNARCGSS